MKYYDFFKARLGSLVCVYEEGGLVSINIPPDKCSSEKEVQKYTEGFKIGFPGKISKVEEDFLEIEYFSVKTFGGVSSGYAGNKSIILPFSITKVVFRMD
jgi:hypothetical protein